jgi:type IV secretion system protein TrbL
MKKSPGYFFFLLLLISISAKADTAINSSGLFDNILQRFAQTSSTWSGVLISYASWLFWSLTTLSMVWTFGMMTLRKADLQELFAEILKFFTVTGFFWWLLINGPVISISIIDSMRALGAKATGLGNTLSPSGIVDIGFDIFIKVSHQSSFWSPVNSIIGLIMAAVILCLFAVIAVNMLLLLIASWILAYGGVFLLGFGGGRWTTDIAINFYKTVLNIGVQIFSMILIIGIGHSFIDQYYAAMGQSTNVEGLAVLLVAAIILFVLVNKVPGLLAGIVGGSQFSGGMGSFGAGAVVGAASVAATAVAIGGNSMVAGLTHAGGGASALMAAFKGAQQNMGENGSAKGGGSSGIGGAFQGMAQFAGHMSSHLMKGVGQMASSKATDVITLAKVAIGETVGGKLAATIHGHTAARQAANASSAASFAGDSVGAAGSGDKSAQEQGAFKEDALSEKEALNSGANEEVKCFVNKEGP